MILPTTKGHAMKNRRLDLLKAELEKVCGKTEVEVVDNSAVYVNFDHATAIVIEPSETDMVGLTVMVWDRSHGVEQEHELGCVRDAYAPAVVREFLEEQQREWDALERAMGLEPGE